MKKSCILGYRIYPKYSDTSTPYHICSKIWTSTIHYPMLCLKFAGWVANSVDPDETPHSVSHLGLYCLLRPVCPNIYGKYGIQNVCPVKILIRLPECTGCSESSLCSRPKVCFLMLWLIYLTTSAPGLLYKICTWFTTQNLHLVYYTKSAPGLLHKICTWFTTQNK